MKSLYSRGDIVLMSFPFTHFDAEKVRPTLILSSLKKYDDYVVLFLTSQVKKYSEDTENILIKQSLSNGLLRDSIVISSKIATVSENMIHEKIGTLSKGDLSKITKAVKKVLGL